MKASYNWLREFVEFSLSHEELAERLTMAGLEVEEIEKKEDDVIYDIGITPNRSDCLSVIGIAREISAILEMPVDKHLEEIENESGPPPDIRIDNTHLCPRYCSRIIRGVRPGASPEWLSRRLESCGIRPANNIVDITNYVLLELGQPLHAFDLDRLAGMKIVVKEAGDADTLTTLDDETRTLSGDMLMIWDAEKPVAVAGVMGGQNTEVSDATVNILLESAFFKPVSVRRTSKRLNLSTDSSYRFERGVDIEGISNALDRAAQMIAVIAGGEVSPATDRYPAPFKPEKLTLSPDRINSLVGTRIDESFVEKALTNLGFKTEMEKGMLSVLVPSFRRDITQDVDVVEEVARLFGYEKIPSSLPLLSMKAPAEKEMQRLIKFLKCAMIRSGYLEVINYSFLNPETLDKLNLKVDDKRREMIFIRNPLRREEAAMRTTLVPGLLTNLNMNLNKGERNLRFFEISKVYLQSGQKLPNEVIQMSAVYRKEAAYSIWKDSHEGFYDLKGVYENIFETLKIENFVFQQITEGAEQYLHPGRSCSMLINGMEVGVIGALHPSVAASFDVKGDITIAEINNLEKILRSIPLKNTYKPLPRFPYVERDMALLVSEETPVSEVKDIILGADSGLIESVHLFDIYRGKPVPPDKKSLAFSIRYRSRERTLKDSEVDELHSRIIKKLQEAIGAELRE